MHPWGVYTCLSGDFVSASLSGTCGGKLGVWTPTYICQGFIGTQFHLAASVWFFPANTGLAFGPCFIHQEMFVDTVVWTSNLMAYSSALPKAEQRSLSLAVTRRKVVSTWGSSPWMRTGETDGSFQAFKRSGKGAWLWLWGQSPGTIVNTNITLQNHPTSANIHLWKQSF